MKAKKKLDFSRLLDPNAILYQANQEATKMTINVDSANSGHFEVPKTQRFAIKQKIEPLKFGIAEDSNPDASSK